MKTAAPVNPAVADVTGLWRARVALRGSDSRRLQLHTGRESQYPSFAQRQSRAALFGGWLHNREELERGLPAVDPPTNDADLVLRAYERWGRDCPNHVRGVFAFVVWDGIRNVAFGARDRVGIHPLFWAFSAGDLLVSPSINELLADPGVPRTFNRSAMVDYLRHTWGNHPQETLYEAVGRIPAGHAFEAASGRLQTWAYWDVLRYDVEMDWLQESDVDHFGGKFDTVVKRFLDLGRCGIFLSGGLDSVSVAASAVEIARSQSVPPPLALSLSFPHPECNEEDVQRAVAARLSLPQVMLPFEQTVAPDGMLWSGLSLSGELEAPLSNGWAPAYNQLRIEARRSGCDVILTGSGGDDWLCPNPLYVADLIRGLKVVELRDVLRNHLRSYDRPALKMLRVLLWGYGARPLLISYANRVLKRVAPDVLRSHRRRHQEAVTPSWLAPDPDLRSKSRERFDQVGEELLKRPEPSGPYGFYLNDGPSSLIRPLNAMELEEQFELSRRTRTLELAPYWDAELVEFLSRIPPRVLDRGGRSKGMVRDTVAKRFPELGFDRQRKVSALSYFGSILANEGLAAWKRLGGAPKLTAMGVVGKELEALAPDQLARPGGGEIDQIIKRHRILDVMHLESWVRGHAA